MQIRTCSVTSQHECVNVGKKCSQQNVMRGKTQHSVTESMAVKYKLHPSARHVTHIQNKEAQPAPG